MELLSVNKLTMSEAVLLADKTLVLIDSAFYFTNNEKPQLPTHYSGCIANISRNYMAGFS